MERQIVGKIQGEKEKNTNMIAIERERNLWLIN